MLCCEVLNIETTKTLTLWGLLYDQYYDSVTGDITRLDTHITFLVQFFMHCFEFNTGVDPKI